MRQHKSQKRNIPRKQSKCLNCGFDLVSKQENYCPECGQKNTLHKAKISTLLSEFFADFFLFDSKIFKSWIFLLFRPGFLTKVYNEGKRVRYISPIRLFLFSGVIFFFILSFVLRDTQWLDGVQISSKTKDKPTFNISYGKKKDDTSESVREDTLSNITIDSSENSLVEMVKTMTEEEIIDSLKIDNKIEELTARQGIKLIKNKGENYAKSIMNNTSIAILCMQPFVALLLGLMYFRRKYFFVDHLIFSLHQHAFLYTLLGLMILFFNQYIETIIIVISIIYTIYLFMSLKTVYKESILKTLVKTTILGNLYLILISICVSLLMGVSFYLF